MAYVAIKNEISEADFTSLITQKGVVEINSFWPGCEYLFGSDDKVIVPKPLFRAASGTFDHLYKQSPKDVYTMVDLVPKKSKADLCHHHKHFGAETMEKFARWLCGYVFEEEDESICIDDWRVARTLGSPRYQNAIIHHILQNMLVYTDDTWFMDECLDVRALASLWKNFGRRHRVEQDYSQED